MMVKNDFEIQPGFKPGSSEILSDALTNELLELWHWSRIDGIYPQTQFNSQAGSLHLSISESKAGISTLYGFSSDREMFPVGPYK